MTERENLLARLERAIGRISEDPVHFTQSAFLLLMRYLEIPRQEGRPILRELIKTEDPLDQRRYREALEGGSSHAQTFLTLQTEAGSMIRCSQDRRGDVRISCTDLTLTPVQAHRFAAELSGWAEARLREAGHDIPGEDQQRRDNVQYLEELLELARRESRDT